MKYLILLFLFSSCANDTNMIKLLYKTKLAAKKNEIVCTTVYKPTHIKGRYCFEYKGEK